MFLHRNLPRHGIIFCGKLWDRKVQGHTDCPDSLCYCVTFKVFVFFALDNLSRTSHGEQWQIYSGSQSVDNQLSLLGSSQNLSSSFACYQTSKLLQLEWRFLVFPMYSSYFECPNSLLTSLSLIQSLGLKSHIRGGNSFPVLHDSQICPCLLIRVSPPTPP